MTQVVPMPGVLATTLGPDLRREGDVWSLDLDQVLLINGLSVLAQALAEQVIAQSKSDCADINVERRLSVRENSELINLLGIASVKVTAEHEAVADIVQQPTLLEDHLRAMLGNLQRERYRSAIFPAGSAGSPSALLATFGGSANERSRRFLMEHVPSSLDRRRGFLRITIEDPSRRHIDIASVPHVEIHDFADRTFIAGSTRIAHTWADLVRRETERGRRSLIEHKSIHKHLFAQLQAGGLGDIEQVAIRWGEAAVPFILEDDVAVLHRRLKRVLLAIEDNSLRALLARRAVVRVDTEGDSIFLDVSHLGRVLNLSLGERRERADIETYLDKMPVLKSTVGRLGPQPLANTHVLLIHHNTSEILGFIAALRQLGCRDLTCLFVAYAGEAPSSFLDALLNLPGDEVDCMALVNVPGGGYVGGHYRLSKQYSSLTNEATLANAVRKYTHSFFGAMQAAGVVAFLGQLSRARVAGKPLLLIEDGGYLAPLLNRAAQLKTPYNVFANTFDFASEDERPLAELLKGTFVGSVEHTKNGHDRLQLVEQEVGLFAPAFSIAVSRLKVDVEAHEVAISVLNAIENVLHASGRILSRRKVLVIGSRGAIGTRIMTALQARLACPERQLYGVDLRVNECRNATRAEYLSLDAARQQRWHETELVIGVTGVSVLKGTDIEDWVLNSTVTELALASGSTKTAEFTEVMDWMDTLMRDPCPSIGGHRITVSESRVVEPLTGRIYGQQFELAPCESGAGIRPKTITFMAQLTPINFLFYGVPTELIDEVLAQLLSVSLGLLRGEERDIFPARLLAVDHEIDADGRRLIAD